MRPSTTMLLTAIVALSSQAEIRVDFGTQKATSSGTIFGGHGKAGTAAEWDMLKAVGVTSARLDLEPGQIVPKTTLDAYKRNEGDVQNEQKWNWSSAAWMHEAKSRGMKVMPIVHRCPGWLSFSGDTIRNSGIPKDTAVYEQIVEKMIRKLQGSTDLVEAWNEPDWLGKSPSTHFLDTTGSGMGHLEGYRRIYNSIYKATKAVSPSIQVGGPATMAPPQKTATNPSNVRAFEWFDSLLNNPSTKSKLDFVSYHCYHVKEGNINQLEPSSGWTRLLLKASGKEGTPIYITEWNRHWDWQKINPTSPDMLPYVGATFIYYLTQGITGGHLHAMSLIVSNGEIKPLARVWRLASVKLGLGRGAIRVMQTLGAAEDTAIGCINADGSKVLLAIGNGRTLSASLRGLGMTGQVEAQVYLASPQNDASAVWMKETLQVQGDSVHIQLSTPENSVIGIVLSGTASSLLHEKALSARRGATPPSGALMTPSGRILDKSSGKNACGVHALPAGSRRLSVK